MARPGSSSSAFSCRDPEKRPSAMQCLQHPYFQVGVRPPLSVRSPASGSSNTAKPGQVQQHAAAQPAAAGQQRAQPQRLVAKELSFNSQKQSLAGFGQAAQAPGAFRSPAQQLQASNSGREAALLPSLGSMGSIGPRNARYKPGMQPALISEAARGARVSDTQPPMQQAPGSLLPTVRKASLGRDLPVSKVAGSVELRYGLGRRY
jgi:hypothetical protein